MEIKTGLREPVVSGSILTFAHNAHIYEAAWLKDVSLRGPPNRAKSGALEGPSGLSALIVCGGHRSSGCEHGDGRRGTPYLEFGGVRWASPKMNSMPLLRLWLSKPHGRQALGLDRTLGKGNMALEA